MKLCFYSIIALICFNLSAAEAPNKLHFASKDSDWNELVGKWEITGKNISPKAKLSVKPAHYVLSRKGVIETSIWSEIRVDFRIVRKGGSIGYALNIQNSTNFGIIRIVNDSAQSRLQAGWLKNGRLRLFLNQPIEQKIGLGQWYSLSIKPTVGISEWRPWTIKIASLKNGNLIFQQGIQNEMPILGRGTVGLYSTDVNVSFKGFLMKLNGIGSMSKDKLKLPPLFKDGMVLQRKINFPVWGIAEPFKSVRITIDNQTVQCFSDSLGNWRTNFSPLSASERVNFIIESGDAVIKLSDVAVGEVWLASGQSNMQMKVRQTDIDSLVKLSEVDPYLRMFIQPQWPSKEPVFSSGGEWQSAVKYHNVKEWSAVAYSFAIELRRNLGVPIGIIGSYWGGTAAESWLRRDVLKQNEITKPILDDYDRGYRALQSNSSLKGIDPWRVPGQRHAPGYLYNGMIFPHRHFAIKGVIWYQGESNAKRAKQYEELFPMLIESWREEWAMPTMPFLFVQLAGYDGKQSGSQIESAWPHLRDAQRLTLNRIKHVGMAVTIDLGNEMNIHPRRKMEVGKRLSRLALCDVYGFEDVVRSGPIFNNLTIKKDTAIVSFTEIAKGLKIRKSPPLSGFMIAGRDRVFYPAQAKISNDSIQVKVWAKNVAQPIAVRYAWGNFPYESNLINSIGLPASPFRTDKWPLKTDEVR